MNVTHTMLSLASEQVWPHIHAVSRFHPGKLILLHSDDKERSVGPALRLKKFFENRTQMMLPGTVHLVEISHVDFNSIEKTLDNLKVNLAECSLNFTGGNKLMATAAFRWAAKRGVHSFYIERGFELLCFEPRDGEIFTQPIERLDRHATDEIDPVHLIRCQQGNAEVEREGQLLRLEHDRVNIEGEGDRQDKKGDMLEFNTAECLLRLGVKKIRRSVRLKVKSSAGVSSRRPVGEFDLLFNFDGRLCLVDCKDTIRSEWMVDGLKKYLNLETENARRLFGSVRDLAVVSQTKVLKEDVLHIKEMAGLLGQVIAVRRNMPTEEIVQFAHDHGVRFVQASNMKEDFNRLLYPNRKAIASDVEALAATWGARK